jgi:chitinase
MLITLKKIFPFFLLFIGKTVLCQSVANYKVIAYYTGNGETIQQYPVNKLTHIIYSFLRLQNDTLTFHSEKQQNTVQELVALKKTYPKLKIMVSIGGWGGCAPCSDLFSSEKHRNTFASTTVSLFEKYGIDGLDLDWEYPAIEGYPGHRFDTDDKNNFTELVKALRKEMGNKYLLTFAAGGFINYLEKSIDWNSVMPLVDFVNLMTYDLVGGYSTMTGHHTLLRDYRSGQESTQKCVNWLLDKKVPADKLIIGAAFYARVWENVADTNHGLYQAGKFKQGVAYKNFPTYFSDSSGYHYYWDKKAKAPYQYNNRKNLFATFDDERSIKEKAKFVRKKNLGGIMFWELSEDKNTDGLVDVLYNSLN